MGRKDPHERRLYCRPRCDILPGMSRALIVHHSKMGKTRRFAEAIGERLSRLGIQPTVASISTFRPEMLDGADLVLLGAWTHGLMIVGQHPDADWAEFARALPPLGTRRVGLFTTYLIATGSMFWAMKRHLANKGGRIELRLKSRSDWLSDANARRLERFAARTV
jgi:flavodoxin